MRDRKKGLIGQLVTLRSFNLFLCHKANQGLVHIYDEALDIHSSTYYSVVSNSMTKH